MQLDVVVQLCRGEELRGPGDDLRFVVLLQRVGEEDEVLDHGEQAFLAQKPLDERVERLDALRLLVAFLHLPPRVEELVRREDGAVLAVDAITQDGEGVVRQEARDVACIAHGDLLVGGVRVGDVVGRVLELEHHDGKAVEEHDGVGDAQLPLLDLELVHHAEGVVVEVLVVGKLDVDVALARVVAFEIEAVCQEPQKGAVGFVKRVLGRPDAGFDLGNLGIGKVGIALDEVEVEVIDDEDLVLLAVKLASGTIDVSHLELVAR